MKLNLSNNKKNENKNVQPAAQVNNNANVMHEVDVTGLMTALKTNGRAKLSEHFKDAEVVEPIEETKPEAKAKPAPKVTIKKKVTLKKKAAPKATYSVEEYTTKKNKTAALLFGFATLEDAQALAGKMSKTVSATWRYDADRKEKRYALSLGARYVTLAHVLCGALNKGDKELIASTCKESVAIYDGAVAEGKARSEERKAERAAAKAAKPAAMAEKKPAAKTYTESEVATLLKSVIAGEAKAMDEVKKLMKKAA